jgi:hypothetical protein
LTVDDDLSAAGLGDDLFAQQRPAAAFDQVQSRIHLVCSIEGQVNHTPSGSGRMVF